ncbi:MAG: DEAD/DEAH box helicase [Fibrobacteria bacterium]
MSDALSPFHPIIQTWFRAHVGAPTDIQVQAWPRIAAGGHVLLTAPTGSGKTLTAFLWALDRFASGSWGAGATRVLYISPLKALNNDIRKNLLAPWEGIRDAFAAATEPRAFPDIRVLVRSGDTPAAERRRMLRNPPEILITTPESLNLMLLSQAGRDSLRALQVVILDEIHAVAGTKRGTHLITAVDRLVPLAGEFQRIALSATVRPLETVAAWVGGYRLGETGYVPRHVECIASRAPKSYALQVRYPVDDAPSGQEEERDIWTSMAAAIKIRVRESRSTLIFANNRRLSERLSRLLNDGEETPLAYAHHGSLSKEIRHVVETRMKEGVLPAIVATNSLELGIDVGALDQVILVQTPFSIASALQKLGRAGHGVGQVSRGLLFASHGRDLLDAAVAVKCVLAADLEATKVVEGPLDLLAQIMLAMAATGDWTVDRLFAAIRVSHPYRHLPRGQFDLVLEMLAGRFEASRIRELRPRLSIDAVDGRITAGKGAALLLGLSGGTIPDRGLYTLRHAETRAKIGELDEEFVWERREGEMFNLGGQSWRIVRITANEVEAVHSDRTAQMAPFWRADERDRGFHFSLRLGEFLEAADTRLDDPSRAEKFAEELAREHGLDHAGADALIAFLRRQRTATRAALPHRHHILIEDAGIWAGGGSGPSAGAALGAGPGDGDRQVILHATWGGKLIRPWAYALAAAYEERTGRRLEIITGDECLLIRLPPDESPGSLLDLVHADNLEAMLRRRLERTGYFAAHFRENAARALLLPRSTTRSRIPLWLNRLRSQSLLQAVSGFADFPIVLETWRECLRDEFDLPALKAMLEEVHAGTIRVTEARSTEPSPFADGLIWKQANKYMYALDKPAEGPVPGREDLLREIAFSSPLRPKIPRAVSAEFQAKAQRLAPGYAPQDAGELVEWAKERLLIPWEEWRALMAACGSPPEGEARSRHFLRLEARLLCILLPGAETAAVAAVETLPRLLAALGYRPQDIRIMPALMGSGDADSMAPTVPERPDADRPAPEAALNALRTLADLEAGNRSAPRESAAEDDDKRKVIDKNGKEEEEEAASADSGLARILSQWLRAYGPVTLELPKALFGAAFPDVEEAIRELTEGDRLIIGLLSETGDASPQLEICDAANLETLLRLMRRRSRPEFRARPAEMLPLFLAFWQGLTGPASDLEGLQACLEKLFGYPAAASAWETDILPARAMPYLPSRMDELFRDSGLLWFGAGKEKTGFAFPEDLELFLPPANGGKGGNDSNGEEAPLTPDQSLVLEPLTAAAPGRMDFQALSARIPLPSDRIITALWDLAWRGRISNDTFAALRKGVETGFKPPPPPAAHAPETGTASPRRRFQRWKAARPLAGAWLALDRLPAAGDALEAEELSKDRVRQLLRRYGVLFRELLGHETQSLQWASVFRSLRLLELSGEVLSGHFFAGIPGLQFISPQAMRSLEGGLAGDAVYWMSAVDPASPCALGLAGLPYALPPRLGSTHLVFHGSDLALVSRRLGRDLLVRVPPRHTYLPGYLSVLGRLVDRAILPVKVLEAETINGEPVLGSPYLGDLLEAGFEQGIRTVTLRKRY